jgi:hypothetical protein
MRDFLITLFAIMFAVGMKECVMNSQPGIVSPLIGKPSKEVRVDAIVNGLYFNEDSSSLIKSFKAYQINDSTEVISVNVYTVKEDTIEFQHDLIPIEIKEKYLYDLRLLGYKSQDTARINDVLFTTMYSKNTKLYLKYSIQKDILVAVHSKDLSYE